MSVAARGSGCVPPAALLLLLCGEDVRGELQDVLSSQSSQMTQSALQLSAASLQQLPQTPVVTLNLVPFLLVASGPPLQPLAVLLGAQVEVSICRRRTLEDETETSTGPQQEQEAEQTHRPSPLRCPRQRPPSAARFSSYTTSASISEETHACQCVPSHVH